MGTLKIFTIYDSKAEAFLQPFFMKSNGQAVRAFQDLANDPEHQFGRYPSDFTLFQIGEYYEDNGTIEMLESKKSLGTALEYQKQQPSSKIEEQSPLARIKLQTDQTLNQ